MNVSVCENGHYLGRSDLLDVDEKFCPACGGKILNQCPNCGAPIRANIYVKYLEYCTSCGLLYPWCSDERKQPLLQINDAI